MYSAFFVSCSLLAYFGQFLLGVRRNIDQRSLAVALLMGSTLLMVFMKLPSLLHGHEDQIVASTRYLATGIFGATLGVIFCRYVLKVGFHRLDDAAYIFPLTIALMKLGCFVAGCCFGLPTEIGVGVLPAAGSAAAIYHGHDTLLHPVQLYESFGSLLICAGIYISRKRWKQNGTLFFIAMAAFFLLRFIAEFFRSTPDWQPVFIGMQINQFVILGLFSLFIWLAYINEKGSMLKELNGLPTDTMPWIVYIATVALAFMFSITGKFHFIEKVVLFVESTFTLYILIKHRSAQSFQRVAALCLVIAISTAQVSQEEALKYHEVKVGWGTGRYENTYSDSDGCNALYRDFEQRYSVFGAGFSTIRETSKSWSEVRYSAWGGSERQTWLDAQTNTFEHKYFNSFGASAYGQIDWRWAGIGGGISVGNLRIADDKIDRNYTKGYFATPVLPSAYVRVGPSDILFADYRYANLFPSAFPGAQHQLSIGSGLGTKQDIRLRYGVMDNWGQFVSLRFPIKKFHIESLYYWGDELTPTQSSAFRFNFSLGYRYDQPSDRKLK